jgi:hypothetical protein
MLGNGIVLFLAPPYRDLLDFESNRLSKLAPSCARYGEPSSLKNSMIVTRAATNSYLKYMFHLRPPFKVYHIKAKFERSGKGV